jgi:serine/threonine-protein kinase
MGEVYLAEHPRLPRCDALKILPADVSADPDYRARFHREADLASTLFHPHIVSVHDRGEYNGQLWISMEFVDGLDAAHLLASRFPAGMPVEQVVRIVTAVASALDSAHKQGLLHRDIKPANIMLTHLEDDDEQRILLADFGIARNVDDISGLTTTNMTVGTVAYSAPEQLMGEDIDGRADQYALAAAAYHLLTGSQLFPHSNPALVISRHLNSPPPALSDTRPELLALDPVLAAALAKDPNGRFPRCLDFARALAEQANPAPGSTAPAAPSTPSPATRTPRRAAAPATPTPPTLLSAAAAPTVSRSQASDSTQSGPPDRRSKGRRATVIANATAQPVAQITAAHDDGAQRVRNHLQRPDHPDRTLTDAKVRSAVYRTAPCVRTARIAWSASTAGLRRCS